MTRDSRLSSVSLALACALALLLAAPAGARKFQMSGTWVYRTGNVFLPLQFATAIVDGTSGGLVHASMGDLTGGFGFPNGPVVGTGGVSATGSAPATLRVPAHRFVADAMAGVPLNHVTLVQIATSFGIDAPYAPATLAPGGGPGSFTWCPGDPACAAGGGMRSTDPPQGAGPVDGRVIYREGANRFGGSMQLGLRRGGSSGIVFDTSPFRVGYAHFGGAGSTLRDVAVGALGSADLPVLRKVYLPRDFVTQPTMVPTAFHLVLYPGPKVTTMLGVSTTGTGGIYYPSVVPSYGTVVEFTSHYGFGQTTGTVLAQQTSGTAGQDFFSVMGSDARTPLGAGNISLVAGGLSVRNVDFIFTTTKTPWASFQKVSLTLGAPIPSLSPSGVAAAAALVLLAAGWALRRRLG